MTEQLSIAECPWCQRTEDFCLDCKIRDHRMNKHTLTQSRMIGMNCSHIEESQMNLEYYSVRFIFAGGKEQIVKWEKDNWQQVHNLIQGPDGFKIRSNPPTPTEGSYINFRNVAFIQVSEWTEDKKEGWF